MSRTVISKHASAKRKCKHCKELFRPDARNWHHQEYCSKEECRKSSKAASQQRWLESGKGAGYFKGPFQVDRVRRWRKAHPCYSKRKEASLTPPPDALQDFINTQVVEKEQDKKVPEISQNAALQDFCFMQPALIIGLIANLTGSTLQDDIVKTSRCLINYGSDILHNVTPKQSTS